MKWVIYLLAALPSIILHEVAHGYVANAYGDPTAKNAGRLTLNPLKHIDPFGTILLPVLLLFTLGTPIGYAKPVPVTVSRLRDPRNQSVYVALAGPLTNIILVVVAWIYCRTFLHFQPDVALNLISGASTNYFFVFGIELGMVNLFLAALNLLPIPPLDGSAVVERLVPRRHLPRYFAIRGRALPFAMVALLAIIYVGGSHSIGTQVSNSLATFWVNRIL